MGPKPQYTTQNSIHSTCYRLEEMILDHGLTCHNLAVKLLQSLTGLVSTNC